MMCSGFAKWGSGAQAGVTPCSRNGSRTFLGKSYCVPHYYVAKAMVLDQLVDLDAEYNAEYQRGWRDAMNDVKDACRKLQLDPKSASSAPSR
jgi:hypothetical protein